MLSFFSWPTGRWDFPEGRAVNFVFPAFARAPTPQIINGSSLDQKHDNCLDGKTNTWIPINCNFFPHIKYIFISTCKVSKTTHTTKEPENMGLLGSYQNVLTPKCLFLWALLEHWSMPTGSRKVWHMETSEIKDMGHLILRHIVSELIQISFVGCLWQT